MYLKIDWATFQFNPADMDRLQLSRFLTDDDLAWKQFGRSEGSRFVSPYGVTYLQNCGCQDRSTMIQFTGEGCDRFADKLLEFRNIAPNHLSRCDLTFDRLVSRQDWNAFVHRAFDIMANGERKEKRVRLEMSGLDAATIYIGARTSPFYFRIYNKTLEDPTFKALDDLGNVIDTPDDYYLIRYECEFKRYRRTRRGENILYDPSVYFDLYFDNFEELIARLRNLWISYAPPEFLEGICWEPSEWVTYTKLKFCCVREDNFIAQWPEIACDPVPCSKGIEWIVDRFGQYIPFIVNDPYLWQICIQKFRVKFGFDPGLEISWRVVPEDVYSDELPWDDLDKSQQLEFNLEDDHLWK